MTNEAIYDAITNISDGLIEEAETHSFRQKSFLRRFAPLAAALAVTGGLGAGIVTGNIRIPGFGAGAGNNQMTGDGVTYTHYAGPVFPLTVAGDAEGVAAARSLDYDFSPYIAEARSYEYEGERHEYTGYSSKAIVTDAYTLTNSTDADRALTLLYPVAGRLSELSSLDMTITVDGGVVETERHAGPYTGDFVPAYGSRNSDERLNLERLQSWKGYRDLLADGSYQEAAFAPLPDIDGTPVVIYKVDNYEVAPTDATNPTLQFSCYLDDGTKAMTYNVNGWLRDWETGLRAYSIGGLDNTYNPPEPMYIILLGGDIDGYTLQGYRDGGCDEGEELEITATVVRYESTLGEMLRMVARDMIGNDPVAEHELPQHFDSLTGEEVYGYIGDYMLRYGVLSDDPADRYETGELRELYEALSADRVIYFRFDVTIPAHGSVSVVATSVKEASRNYVVRGRDTRSNGYDMVTRLGSTLNFTEQRASVSHTDEITLLNNNFGFDLDGGITAVVLDQSTEHYWMQIARKTISPQLR